MEKSPPRSYKKQQKIEKKETIQENKKKLKVTNINQSLSTRKVDWKLCKNLKIEKQHQLGFGEPNWINSLTSGTT